MICEYHTKMSRRDFDFLKKLKSFYFDVDPEKWWKNFWSDFQSIFLWFEYCIERKKFWTKNLYMTLTELTFEIWWSKLHHFILTTLSRSSLKSAVRFSILQNIFFFKWSSRIIPFLGIREESSILIKINFFSISKT